MAGRRLSRCCCLCPGCTSPRPAEWQVTLAGIANDACDDCTNLNGIWDVPWQIKYLGICHWQEQIDSICDGDEPCFLNIVMHPGLLGTPYIQVQLRGGVLDAYPQIVWTKELSTPLDCENVSGLSLPLTLDDHLCDGSSATCNITAL